MAAAWKESAVDVDAVVVVDDDVSPRDGTGKAESKPPDWRLHCRLEDSKLVKAASALPPLRLLRQPRPKTAAPADWAAHLRLLLLRRPPGWAATKRERVGRGKWPRARQEDRHFRHRWPPRLPIPATGSKESSKRPADRRQRAALPARRADCDSAPWRRRKKA